MFEQLKRKRMLIEESVKGKRTDRDGMSSGERRRLVEKDITQYDQMLRTMQDFRKTQARNLGDSPASRTYHDQSFQERAQEMDSSRPPLNTPTVKDISPSLEQSALANEFYELSADPKNDSFAFSPGKNNHLANFYKKQPESQNKSPVNLSQAPEPSLPHREEVDPSEKVEINIHNMDEHSSRRDSEPHIEDEEIKFPKIVNSSRTESNNNSEAIFFTSQFKEFLNNEVNSPKKPLSPLGEEIKEQPLPEANEPIESRAAELNRLDKNLRSNASGQSLAISNESSLKYSLINESAIQDIISRKLSNELVIESISSPKASTLARLATGLLIRENFKDFMEFSKALTLSKFIQKRELISVFDELMINKEYRFHSRKSEIKAANFCQERSESLIGGCFYEWFGIAKARREKIEALLASKERQLKEKSFKTLKMLHFDRKINNQIELYYLSKLFLAFRTVTEKESKKANQKAYRLYFKTLKRRMFHAFIEGCYNTRRESEVAESAYNHYYYTTLQKYFSSWKRLLPKEEKFIRLAMTTKNALKETSDHRLLQTRTFDFYEIR